MIPDVYSLLHTASVSALVGNRIYRHGTAPQDVAAPYVTWFVVSGIPENHLDGTPPTDAFSVQCDVWTANTGAGITQANTIGEALRDAIEAQFHITNIGGDSQDYPTQRYRLSLTFTFWNPRS